MGHIKTVRTIVRQKLKILKKEPIEPTIFVKIKGDRLQAVSRMTQSQVSVSSLSRSLTALETWGFGFSGLLLWLGTAPAIYTALGAKAIWVWLPGTIVGILLNLQVKQLGKHFLNVAGGTPNYTTRLLQKFPALARYSAIGYLLGWVSVPAINAVILTRSDSREFETVRHTLPGCTV